MAWTCFSVVSFTAVKGIRTFRPPEVLSLKILNVLILRSRRFTFLKRIKFLYKAIATKKTELARKEAHTFFSLSNYISSDHEDRCKCNSTLKTLNHGINYGGYSSQSTSVWHRPKFVRFVRNMWPAKCWNHKVVMFITNSTPTFCYFFDSRQRHVFMQLFMGFKSRVCKWASKTLTADCGLSLKHGLRTAHIKTAL